LSAFLIIYSIKNYKSCNVRHVGSCCDGGRDRGGVRHDVRDGDDRGR